jgi:hypothetical protein
MHKVLSQTFSNPTNTTIITVINPLIRIILPQLALAAVIPRRVFSTLNALLSGRLRRTTKHAEHILRHLTIQRVRKWQVFGIVVAVPAGEPPLAVVALNLDIPLVVHASEIRNLLLVVVDGILVAVVAEIVGPGRKRAEAGTCIPRTQLIWIARVVDRVVER